MPHHACLAGLPGDPYCSRVGGGLWRRAARTSASAGAGCPCACHPYAHIHTHAYSYQHTYDHTHTHTRARAAHRNAYALAYHHPNSYTLAYHHPNSYPYAYHHPNSYPYAHYRARAAHRNAYANTHAHHHPDAYANAHAYHHRDAYANAYHHPNSYPYAHYRARAAHRNAYANTHAHHHPDAYANAHAYHHPDAYANAHPHHHPDPTPTPTPTQTPFEEINFAGVITLTNTPSQVQVVFSLRDQDGHAIVLPAQEIENATRVYERADRDDDWEEIDYSETSYFVHTAENFQLEVVFVLDFTNSMAQATLPDGRTGVDAMLSAFESAVTSLPGAHRIGVVEFHDRNVEPSVLSRPTIDRSAVLASVRRFAQSGFDHGSSRVWDSLAAASDLFSREAGVVKALVFLSDGRDTSSLNNREQAAAYARERKVQLYALGVGDVYEEDELRAAALQTEGSYYRAQQFAGLEDQLETIVGDLRGQYKISYITLRRAGRYQARISVTLRGAEGNFHTETFDVARFFGPDNRGVVQFDPASVDRASGQATLFMRALHVPRNIGRIRFRLETSKPVAVELVSGEDGGLLDGWSLSGPDADGFFESPPGSPSSSATSGPSSG